MSENNNQMQSYVRGSLIGLTVGILAAYLYNRAVEESGSGDSKVNAGDIVKVSLAVLALVRQITELGSGNK